jgi:hypothetical protein
LNEIAPPRQLNRYALLITMNYVVKAETGHINFSPVGFRKAAEDFINAYDSFNPSKFSVVPYFFCCRAIELAIKSMHLEVQTHMKVKNSFWHDLRKAYDALPPSKQVLLTAEEDVLDQANILYKAKAFEYVQPFDAATSYRRFPDLDKLARLGRKLIAACA